MNAAYLHLDANFVKAEIAKLIEAYPELAEDETLLADMVEAETDATRIIERALLVKLEAETMAEAIKSREGDLYARRGRKERQAAAMKSLIKNVMQAARLPKMELPEATLSIIAGRKSVNVTSLEDLPQGFYRVERKADSKALMEALSKGETIPGAKLVTGDAGLMIRTK